MKAELEPYVALCDAIGKLFYPNVEVVMHDLSSKQLVYIVNAFSKRRIGDAMAGDLKDLTSIQGDWVGPYDKLTSSGKRLKAVSIILRDTQKKPIGIICLNYNIETIETLFDALKGLLPSEEAPTQPAALFSQNWKEHTDQTIEQFLTKHQVSLEGLSQNDKKALVTYLEQEGIFNIRNVVGYLCQILSISRATVYNWLKKNKQEA